MPGPRPLLHLLLLASLLAAIPSGTAEATAPANARMESAVPVASYAIDVTLDVDAKTLSASQRARYLNTTDKPIPDLVFHLYLNAFRDANSVFMKEGGARLRGFAWDPDHPGWITVTTIRLSDGTPLAMEEIEDGTLARAALPQAVAPGEAVEVEIEFLAQLPRVFARTGFAGDFFMVGQWFPKFGVWQQGAWNAYPFHANAEFYADFGTYDVAITLPELYVTGASGLPGPIDDNGDGTRTVRYHADQVVDFAWAASPRFEEATRRVGEVEVMYLYLPEHEWTVARVLTVAEAALVRFGQWFGPYPYARLTIVDVPDDGQGAGGMEYPTLVTSGLIDPTGLGLLGGPGGRLLEAVVAHEIGHQWWQSMVAFNEAEEPWLDEGLTDYAAVTLLEELYGAEASLLGVGLPVGYLDLRRMEYLVSPRVKMYGRAWDFGPATYSVAAYSKPVVALRTMENVLGRERMRAVLRAFFQRHQYGHPTTEDFRVVAEEVSGQDLAWFFDGLVYGDGVLNYAVTAVDDRRVTVARQGDLVLPTEVLVTFADGSTALETWDGAGTEIAFAYDDRLPVRSAEVDPGRRLAVDLRWSDNSLARRPDLWSWMALATRMLYGVQNALLIAGGW